MMRIRSFAAIAAAAASLAACGGGGGGGSAPPAPSGGSGAGSTPTSTPSPAAYPVAGTVSVLGAPGYGASASASPLAGAVVVVGPTLVAGATPPAAAPPGDAMVTTDAAGRWTATLSVAPALSDTNQAPILLPVNNVFGIPSPAPGYYVAVFGPSSDGVSAGSLIARHGFTTPSTATTQHLSALSSAEAAFLALVNSDRATAFAPPVIPDELAQEAAREHAADMLAKQYLCHYDLQNRGPATRYVSIGGLGQIGENLALDSGATDVALITSAEANFMSEKSSGGGHYLNIIDAGHIWAGLAASRSILNGGYVDEEFVSTGKAASSQDIYPSTYCPSSLTTNNS